MPVPEFGQLAEVPEPSRSRTYGVSGTEKTIQVSAPVSDAVRTRTSRRASAKAVLAIAAVGFLGQRGNADAASSAARCSPDVASSPRLLRDVPNALYDRLPGPLYGVPKLFITKPHFTKNGSTFYTGVAVWKGSDEELVARGTERETGQRATFIIQRGGRDHRRTCRYRAAGASTSKQRAPPSQFR